MSGTTAPPPFDPTDPKERTWLVGEVRGQIGAKYGADYERRCAACAAYMLNALRQVGITSYRIAAGGVDETALATATTGNPPRVPRYRGEYTDSGESNYHVWLIDDATGHKIDCSEMPWDYKRPHLWEPYETVPEVAYREVQATTQAVQAEVKRIYGL
jgi:hypothetical protein